MIRIIEKGLPGKLSTHILKGEFDCRCTNDNCIATIYHDDLMVKFEELRSKWGLPITIKSGYRCPFHNKKTFASSKLSKHMMGMAMDLKCPFGVEFDKFIEEARKIFPFVLPYKTTRMIHVDIYQRD